MKPHLEWQALEYPAKVRTSDWYIATIIIAVSIAVSAVIFNNTLFAVVIIIATITLFMYIRRPPRLIRFEINPEGVISGEILYPFKNLTAFGIDGPESAPKLILKAQSGFLPIITLPLGGIDPDLVKNYLSNHIQEEPLQIPISERVMDFLGF